MEKIKISRFPFIFTAEKKTSRAGKDYISIGIGLSSKTGQKTADGKDEYKTTWLNTIDKANLLVLSAGSGELYNRISDAENNHASGNVSGTAQNPEILGSNDNLPF